MVTTDEVSQKTSDGQHADSNCVTIKTQINYKSVVKNTNDCQQKLNKFMNITVILNSLPLYFCEVLTIKKRMCYL